MVQGGQMGHSAESTAYHSRTSHNPPVCHSRTAEQPGQQHPQKHVTMLQCIRMPGLAISALKDTCTSHICISCKFHARFFSPMK